MKEIFIAGEGLPGTEDFMATVFMLESKKASNTRDLKRLAEKAAEMYALTEEGISDFRANCENYNWGDLINTSNETFKKICDNIGIEIKWLGTADSEQWCDANEQLMQLGTQTN